MVHLGDQARLSIRLPQPQGRNERKHQSGRGEEGEFQGLAQDQRPS